MRTTALFLMAVAFRWSLVATAPVSSISRRWEPKGSSPSKKSRHAPRRPTHRRGQPPEPWPNFLWSMLPATSAQLIAASLPYAHPVDVHVPALARTQDDELVHPFQRELLLVGPRVDRGADLLAVEIELHPCPVPAPVDVHKHPYVCHSSSVCWVPVALTALAGH